MSLKSFILVSSFCLFLSASYLPNAMAEESLPAVQVGESSVVEAPVILNNGDPGVDCEVEACIESSEPEEAAPDSAENSVGKDEETSNAGEEGEAEIADPLEIVNRPVFAFNDFLLEWALIPVANGYEYITPGVVQIGIKNIFSNLGSPVNMVNNLLQGNPKGFSSEFLRLFINSTFGLGGIFDVASAMGINKESADFGQTLGMYGIPGGYPIVLPFFGNFNFRDVFGSAGDLAATPSTYFGPFLYGLPGSMSYGTVKAVNDTSLYSKDYEDFKKSALDFYSASVEARQSYRLKQIKKAKERSLFFN